LKNDRTESGHVSDVPNALGTSKDGPGGANDDEQNKYVQAAEEIMSSPTGGSRGFSIKDRAKYHDKKTLWGDAGGTKFIEWISIKTRTLFKWVCNNDSLE
jgi:hypothetical protein